VINDLKPHHALALSEIALTLNATLDVDNLLRHIVNAASVLLDTDGALVLIAEEGRRGLRLRALYDAAMEKPSLPVLDLALGDTPASVVFRDGVAQTAEFDPDLSAVLPLVPQSLLYMPIKSQHSMIGVLVVYHTANKQPFSDYHHALLHRLTAHAAIAIENAHHYAESQTRSFELALLIDAAEAVNSTLSLPDVLSLIGKTLLRAIHGDWCEINLGNLEQGVLTTLSSQQQRYWHTPDQSPYIELPPQLRTALHQQSYVKIQADQTLDQPELLGFLGGVLLLPVKSQNTLRGVVRLLFDQAFDEDKLDIEGLAPKIAWLAESALAGDAKRAMSFAHQIRRGTNAASCAFWLADGSLLLQDSDLIWSKPQRPIRNLADMPRLLKAMQRSEVGNYTFENATNLPPDIQALMQRHHLQRLLLLPFIIHDDTLGLVLLGNSQRRHAFGSREISLAQGLVLQAANAIKNAQLFADLQDRMEELRHTQARLVETARLSAIGELAAAVAHQINNPLTTILGDTQMLLADTPTEDPRHEALLAVHRAGQRSREVVQRLLTMARQKSDDDRLQMMDINTTIYNTLSLVEGTLMRGRVQLECTLAPDLPPAYGLSGQLEDVWLNLILNARDAVRQVEKPVIGIESRYNLEENCLEVIVWDNGHGLGEKDPAQLFAAFYTTKPMGEGTGLGLYICATVIKNCGGKISARNAPTGGAMFTVLLQTGKTA